MIDTTYNCMCAIRRLGRVHDDSIRRRGRVPDEGMLLFLVYLELNVFQLSSNLLLIL